MNKIMMIIVDSVYSRMGSHLSSPTLSVCCLWTTVLQNCMRYVPAFGRLDYIGPALPETYHFRAIAQSTGRSRLFLSSLSSSLTPLPPPPDRKSCIPRKAKITSYCRFQRGTSLLVKRKWVSSVIEQLPPIWGGERGERERDIEGRTSRGTRNRRDSHAGQSTPFASAAGTLHRAKCTRGMSPQCNRWCSTRMNVAVCVEQIAFMPGIE